MNKTDKNKKIAESGKKTREKRKSQVCFVRKIKIDASELTKVQREQLQMIFVEAKWLVNEAIAFSRTGSIFDYEPQKSVVHKDKNFNDITTDYKYIGSQMKQALVKEIKSNAATLAISPVGAIGSKHNKSKALACTFT